MSLFIIFYLCETFKWWVYSAGFIDEKVKTRNSYLQVYKYLQM